MKEIAPIFEALGRLETESTNISEQPNLTSVSAELRAYIGRVLDNVLSYGLNLLFDHPPKESVVERSDQKEFITPKGRKIRYEIVWIKEQQAKIPFFTLV